MVAKDIMTTDVVVVRKDTPVADIAMLMATHGISGVPVVDDDDHIVGVVTEDDLLLKHDMQKGAPHRIALFGLWVVPDEMLQKAYCKARCEATAADLMTKNVVFFEEEDDVDKIAEVMVQKRINRVPIVRDGKLVGIVSRADILRGIAGVPR